MKTGKSLASTTLFLSSLSGEVAVRTNLAHSVLVWLEWRQRLSSESTAEVWWRLAWTMTTDGWEGEDNE